MFKWSFDFLMDHQVCLLYHWLTACEKAADNKVSSISFFVPFQLSALLAPLKASALLWLNSRDQAWSLSVLLHSLINRDSGLVFVYSAVFLHFKPRPSISEINAGPFNHSESTKTLCSWCVDGVFCDGDMRRKSVSSTFPISFSL